jgi:hypothetical protein
MKKKEKKQQKYNLIITYPADRYMSLWVSDSNHPDRRIEAVIGNGDRQGSGCGWGERDIDYLFESRDEALKAKKAITSLKIKGLRSSISKYDGDDDEV